MTNTVALVKKKHKHTHKNKLNLHQHALVHLQNSYEQACNWVQLYKIVQHRTDLITFLILQTITIARIIVY